MTEKKYKSISVNDNFQTKVTPKTQRVVFGILVTLIITVMIKDQHG